MTALTQEISLPAEILHVVFARLQADFAKEVKGGGVLHWKKVESDLQRCIRVSKHWRGERKSV